MLGRLASGIDDLRIGIMVAAPGAALLSGCVSPIT
jgi:hypothetical protein